MSLVKQECGISSHHEQYKTHLRLGYHLVAGTFTSYLEIYYTVFSTYSAYQYHHTGHIDEYIDIFFRNVVYSTYDNPLSCYIHT
jgi:hypothetical protein